MLKRTASGSQLDWRDFWGQRHRETFPDEDAARFYMELTAAQLKADRLRARTVTRDVPIWTAATIFLSPAAHAIRPRSLQTYRDYLHAFLKTARQQLAASVSPLQLQAHFAQRYHQLSPHTYYREVQTLKRFFHWMRANQIIPLDPSCELHAAYPRSTPGRELTYREESRLLKVISSYNLPRLLLALDLGLRDYDLKRLRCHQFDLQDRLITFTVSKPYRHEKRLPLTQRLTTCLEENFPALKPDEFLYSHRGNFVVNRSWFLRLTAAAAVQARIHDLRHTFFNRLAEASEWFLAAYCVGHSLDLPGEIYRHYSLSRFREAFRQMEEKTKAELFVCEMSRLYEPGKGVA